MSSIIFPDYKGAQTHKKKKKKNSKKKERQNNDSSPCAASSSTQPGILKEGVEGPYEISTQVAHFDLFSYFIDFFRKAYCIIA